MIANIRAALAMKRGLPAEMPVMRERDGKLVYSTETGWPDGEPKSSRTAPHGGRQVPDDGVIRVAREGRRGGVVSVVTGLPERTLAPTAKALKKLCGSGGTAKNGTVEIQGDHRDRIVEYFQAAGLRVKKAGG
ncbi:MAG: stress response translation initiation inhibitor YciH [Vulcanimicrobiaceae bacterium]